MHTRTMESRNAGKNVIEAVSTDSLLSYPFVLLIDTDAIGRRIKFGVWPFRQTDIIAIAGGCNIGGTNGVDFP